MTKIADLRARLPEIAAHRLKGAAWSDIAKLLVETGLTITPNELRPYWARLSGGRHPAEIVLEAVGARAEEAERQAAASKEFANAQLRAAHALGPYVGEVNRLRNRVDALEARNAELEAIQAQAAEASASVEELERLHAKIDALLALNAELEAVAARAEQAERRAALEEAGEAEELVSLRRQVNDLQRRNAELEAESVRAEEAGLWAATQADTYEALSELLLGQRDELQARNAEIQADLRAVDFMSLGVGVGRRSRRGLARYAGM